jgi:hypothetical protein
MPAAYTYKNKTLKFNETKLRYKDVLYDAADIQKMTNGWRTLNDFYLQYFSTTIAISLVFAFFLPLWGFSIQNPLDNAFANYLALAIALFAIIFMFSYPLGRLIRGYNTRSKRFLTIYLLNGKNFVIDFGAIPNGRQTRAQFLSQFGQTVATLRRSPDAQPQAGALNAWQPVMSAASASTDSAYMRPTSTPTFVSILPEEQVRQMAIAVLIQQCGYAPEQIAIEFPIRLGSSNRRLDIAVFAPNSPKLQENILLIVECKRADRKNDDEGMRQLKSYLAVCMNATYGVLASHRWVTLRKEMQANGWAFVPSEFMPHANGYFTPIRYG